MRAERTPTINEWGRGRGRGGGGSLGDAVPSWQGGRGVGASSRQRREVELISADGDVPLRSPGGLIPAGGVKALLLREGLLAAAKAVEGVLAASEIGGQRSGIGVERSKGGGGVQRGGVERRREGGVGVERGKGGG